MSKRTRTIAQGSVESWINGVTTLNGIAYLPFDTTREYRADVRVRCVDYGHLSVCITKADLYIDVCADLRR